MEGAMVQNQPSSGKIGRHNSHLLDDDIGMMQDSLDTNKPHTSGTHSSEESRLIDGSPDRYNEDAGSEGSIETEKQYQEDLKERVKRSFAELGLNPDDIIQGNKERSISPRDSLDAPVDLNDKQTVDKDDGIFRDSIEEDFDEQKDIKEAVAYPLSKSKSNDSQSDPGSQESFNEEESNQSQFQGDDCEPLENKRNLGEQEQVAHHNQNNSAGIVDGKHDDDNHPSDYPNRTPLPVDDDLQLRTNGGNNLENPEGNHAGSKRNLENPEGNHVGSKRNSHGSGSSNSYSEPLNNRKESIGSAGKTAVRKPPSGRKLDVISPENMSVSPQRSPFHDPALLQKSSVSKQEGSKDLIETLPGGEKVRVEYISDDSGDDDEHYVDEKGSPIHFDEASEEDHRQEYRIKPRPPATPVDSSKQTRKLRRYSLERRQTPSKQEPIISSTNAGILSIEKVPADPVNWDKLKSTEEALIVAHVADTGNLEDSIPNLMKHENSKDASATSQKLGEAENKFVDADVYEKMQLKAQQKIRSREASADRQSKKGYVRPYQPSLRYHSSRKSTGTQERPSRNGSTTLGSRERSKERSKNNASSIDKYGSMHGNDKEHFESNHREAHLTHERERTGEKGNLSSMGHEGNEPLNRATLTDNHHSQQQTHYQNRNDPFGGQTSQVLPSAPPHVEPGYQQNLNHQTDYEEDGNTQQQVLLYAGPDQVSQYPAHPIQPAYQPVTLQQQHVQYSQGTAPYQRPPQQQQVQYSGTAPYQGPPQPNQTPYHISSQPYNQTEPVQYHDNDENHMYQSNQQNQFPLQNYNQYQAPYHNLNQDNQNSVNYQARFDNQIQIQNYQPTQSNVSHPGNQFTFHSNQGQQRLSQGGQAFDLHNRHIYPGLQHVPAGSFPQTQQFYQENPDRFQQEHQQHQYQLQQASQPHFLPPHQSLHGSSQQPLLGIQRNHQPLDPHYQMQHYGQQQQLNVANEGIPLLDLRSLADDHLQAEQHSRISPAAHHVSNLPTNSTRKANIEKSKINFIEQNKAKLRRELPQRGYLDRYKKDINPRKPLPGISRENSEEKYEQWAQEEPGNNYEDTWSTDPRVDQRRFMQLPRQQSDTAVRYSNTDLRNMMSPEQYTDYPQSAPVNFQVGNVFKNKYDDYESSSPPPTWPPFNTRGSQIQFASFSADHATSYARMQYRPKVISKLEHSPRSSLNRPGPYTVLPNIQNEETDELRNSDPDGYLAKMQKSKQGPQYKQYTLKDYQKLRIDTQLGGLGPDTDAAQEKQEKVMRQREYAKQVMMQNRKAFQQSKVPRWLPEHASPQERRPTKRDLAIEYSKKVPKPRLPTPPEEQHERIYGASSQQNDVDTEEEMRQLEQLRLRHEKEKQEVAKIKKEIRT